MKWLARQIDRAYLRSIEVAFVLGFLAWYLFTNKTVGRK